MCGTAIPGPGDLPVEFGAGSGPGDTIHLADGTYTGNFKAAVPGPASARIP